VVTDIHRRQNMVIQKALYENTRIFIRLWAFNMPKSPSGTQNHESK
jgi:hypothetical protein